MATSDEAYALYTKARTDATKAAQALLDFSGPGGSATQASMDKANALQNRAGSDALAAIGYYADANGEMVKGTKPTTTTDAAATTGTAVGYTGFTAGQSNSPPAGVDMRTMIERTTGKAFDSSFYSGPDADANLALLTRISNALYGDVGANIDARNWTAIMASSNPLKAAEDALAAMYSDKAYLTANTQYVMNQGYLPEQADYTYQQMADRVGSTYTPTWVEGTKFEGVDPATKQPKMDTATYLKNVSSMAPDQLASYTATRWNQWGGNPTTKKSGVIDTGTSASSVFTPATTAGQITGTSNVTPGAVIGTSNVTPGTSTVTPGSTGSTGLITGATTANSTAAATPQTAPTQLNTPTAAGGTGLVTGANTLTPGTFNLPNTTIGNVNSGGLISGVQQQLTTQNAQVGLPTGVTAKVGAMGNNTGGASMTPYNPYGFTGSMAGTGAQQNWYNAKTGQRYTAPVGSWTPPSADWTRA